MINDNIVTVILDKKKCCYHMLSPMNIFKHLLDSDNTISLKRISNVTEPDWSITIEINNEDEDIYHTWITQISTLHLNGINGITDFCVYETNPHQTVIMTNGSNLSEILQQNVPYVNNILSNHIHQVYTTLGIDAFRHVVIQEWTGVINTNDIDIGVRHIMLIADVMSYSGYPAPINYQGICKHSDVPVIKKASFEKTMESLVHGAVTGQHDSVNSVSSSICFNRLSKYGSSHVTLCQEKYTIPPNMPSHPTANKRRKPTLYNLDPQTDIIVRRIPKRQLMYLQTNTITHKNKKLKVCNIFRFSQDGLGFTPFQI
jgi:DNA-directed RNA polymerase beta' subunit